MIHIDYIICPDYIEDKLEAKHSVVMQEVRQVLVASHAFVLLKKGMSEEKMSTQHSDKHMQVVISQYFSSTNRIVPRPLSSAVEI